MSENHWYLVDFQAGLYVCGYCGCISINRYIVDNKTGLEIHREGCPDN